MKLAWMKFYPADWRSDPRLRMCSLAARGLWMDMLGLMHEAEPYGHLLISTKAPTDTQLGALVGAPPSQITELLGELEEAGVFSRAKAGVIYSRRMTRDAKKAALARKNGKSGGNPKLCGQRENSPPDNHTFNHGDKTQRPEARNQKPEYKDAQPFEVPDRTAEQSRFSEFWRAYPRKEGELQAEAEFITATISVDADRIIAGAHAYAASRAGEDPKFTLLAARWLHQKRWTDQHAAKHAEADPEIAHLQRIAAGYGAR